MNKKTAIIFGINGQDGFYLKELLTHNAYEIIGISKEENNEKVDIRKYESIAALIQRYQPNYIFHLAAKSSTKHELVFINHDIISTGTLCILEAVKNFSPQTKVFISGSGLQFENHNQPIKENDNFEARDPYSISRIQSVYAARYYRGLGIKVYVGYFFNHDSPRRKEQHMSKKITELVKRIKNGADEKIEIGDIEVIKEWTFAQDTMQALWLFMQQEKIFEINLASGLGYSIKDWLEICFKTINKNWQDYIIIKSNFKPEYQQLIADASLIKSLGWEPKISIQELAVLMLQ